MSASALARSAEFLASCASAWASAAWYGRGSIANSGLPARTVSPSAKKTRLQLAADAGPDRDRLDRLDVADGAEAERHGLLLDRGHGHRDRRPARLLRRAGAAAAARREREDEGRRDGRGEPGGGLPRGVPSLGSGGRNERTDRSLCHGLSFCSMTATVAWRVGEAMPMS